MGIKERIINYFARDIIEQQVEAGIRKARMALPITANYDPNNEGYRRLTGDGQQRRDLSGISQDRMFEVAYFMWDSSAMTKRMAKMDKGFLFAEPITINSEDEAVQEIIDTFQDDPANNMVLKFPDRIMWLGLLGEQCWPVEVNPHNGHVHLLYADPAHIKDVWLNPDNIEEVWQVEFLGRAGRPGRKMEVIRQDWSDANSPAFGKLMGEVFFFSINHPPNSPRGRSDFLTLYDWIDGLERYGFNYLERAEFLLNFIWDVLLEGMNEEEIREWTRDNPPPQAGSIRAHNERVKWNAVAPQLNAVDMKAGFDAIKGFIMGAAGRPDSWFGGGGKAYQTEAEQFGQVPIKDLDERQLHIKAIYHQIIQFVIDQAVSHKRLSEKRAQAGFTINMPEISKNDLTDLMTGMPQLATAMIVAEDNGWIAHDTAMRLFAFVTSQLGFEVDVDAELEKARARGKTEGLEDYLKKSA